MNHQAIHAFTSITSNYLPKARVLARSIKQVDPAVRFHVMLCDEPPPGFDLAAEPFDSIIALEDLQVPNLRQWIFAHTVVELCTAVKGFAFQVLFDRFAAQKAFYFDPDMVVFSRLDELCNRLDAHSVLLTPHQSCPEETLEAILDNEMASLRHGVFNLGFLGVRASDEGRRLVDWWASRLQHFCHDDIDRGLFTDQRWMDLAPCFFDDIEIMRDAGFNVATWNLTHRRATGSLADGVRVNGEALGFYHFSGFDSGAQETMLTKYGETSPVLFELREWYLAECEHMGQSQLGRWPAKYSTFDDGSPISKAQRVLYREREDLRQAFPDPFSTAEVNHCYRDWFATEAPAQAGCGALTVKPDTRFGVVVMDFIAYTDMRLNNARRVSRWRKSLVRGLLRASRLAARRLLA